MGVAGDSILFEGWLQGVDATKLLLALLPVWVLGAFIGMLVRCRRCCSYPHCVSCRKDLCTHRGLTRLSGTQLPRPRWLETSTRFGAFWLSSPSGVLLRRFALAVHGFVIARHVFSCKSRFFFHYIADMCCAEKYGATAPSQEHFTPLLQLYGVSCKEKASTCSCQMSHLMSMP